MEQPVEFVKSNEMENGSAYAAIIRYLVTRKPAEEVVLPAEPLVEFVRANGMDKWRACAAIIQYRVTKLSVGRIVLIWVEQQAEFVNLNEMENGNAFAPTTK